MQKAPVVIVTTSGTASVNLAPAVAEAFNQRQALFVITADRPEENPVQFSNQRINQLEVFRMNAKDYLELSEPETRYELSTSIRKLLALLDKTIAADPGPVHLNLLFRDKLYLPLPESVSQTALQIAETRRQNAVGIEQQYPDEHPKIVRQGLSMEDSNKLVSAYKAKQKVLILLGMGEYAPAFLKTFKYLLQYSQTVVVAENITNTRENSFFSTPELILGSMSAEERKFLEPDIVLLIGRQIVSKQCKLFIQSLDKVPILSVERPPSEVLSSAAEVCSEDNNNTYLENWKTIKSRAEKKSIDFIKSSPFCNISVMKDILDSLPENSHVHLGNSGTIRYSQLFPVRTDLIYYSNRGTSGIDGCLSTAAGAAMVSKDLHIAILGDLSFVYDSNALWSKNFPDNLRVIILNDKGGGIFGIIDGPDTMSFYEEFSVTRHPVVIEHLVRSFAKEYRYASNSAELQASLGNIFKQKSKASVLEVDTSDSENSAIFKQFYQTLQEQ